MNDDQRKAIHQFFEATKKLKETGVIRSSTYTGDIAEFMCAKELGITLSDSQREPGLDGYDNQNRKVQIKYHGAKVGTNINMSKYVSGDFDDLVVVLSPESNIRPIKCTEGYFSVFKFENYFSSEINNIAKGILEDTDIVYEFKGYSD